MRNFNSKTIINDKQAKYVYKKLEIRKNNQSLVNILGTIKAVQEQTVETVRLFWERN